MTSAARKGDQHACPQTGHSVNAITTGSSNVFINGVPAARLGDSTSCGATIMSGSSTVFINGVPAAIMGSATSHGGVIISGSGNVLIGDTYSPQADVAANQTSHYDEQIQFQTADPKHMAGLAYYIECNDGSTHSGVIGDDGLLPRIPTHQQGEFTVHWGDDAMEKLQA
jgi:Uncharacterized conserved protein